MSAPRSILIDRFEDIGGQLEVVRDAPSIELPDDCGRVKQWDVVGVGASEGPARLTVEALGEAGISASFRSISRYLGRPIERPDRGLLIFSQGLSPNAQLALDHASSYAMSFLFTAVGQHSRPERFRLLREFPGAVLTHPPKAEAGTLLRLVGPSCAALLALKFCIGLIEKFGGTPAWADYLDEVPRVYRARTAKLPDALGRDPLACVALGMDADLARCLMWKWQEGLYTRLPVTTDVLSFAHGPLQSFFEQQATFFSLVRRGDGVHADIYARLAQSLHATRHRLVPLTADLPGPLAYFEYDAQLDAHLLAELQARGINPEVWPGQGSDGPLYSLHSTRSGSTED